MMNEIDYVIEQAKKLLSIDSPTGYTKNVIQYLKEQYEDMVFAINESMFTDFVKEESKNFLLIK